MDLTDQACAALDDGKISLFVLRPEHVSETYVAWLNDEEVKHFLESRFDVHTLESTRAFVSANLAAPDAVLFGIRSLTLGAHVGNIRLGYIHPHHRTGEIGIMVGDRRAWGQGVASGAIRLVCDFAARTLALRKITAGCYALNRGSLRAFEKAGFVTEAVRKDQCLLQGESADIVLLGRML
jgi:[ribosomal protein S5]-alanine N-acetyltransferase